MRRLWQLQHHNVLHRHQLGCRVEAAYLDPATLNFVGSQPLGPGIGMVTVTVNNGTPNTGTISVGSVTFTANQASQPFSFQPVNAGTTIISIPTPPPSGFSTPSNYQSFVVTVAAPNMNLSNATVGDNLETTVSASLPGRSAECDQHHRLPAAIPRGVLLSTDPTMIGGSSVSVPVAKGGSSSSTQIYVQALAGSGTVTLSASAAGYNSQTNTVTLVPSGFVVFSQCVGCENFQHHDIFIRPPASLVSKRRTSIR